ncbi:MAG TPA: hypothetical protein VLK84_07160 [Longimicrobium sp.]|nr:hypothetical protein [Longimicrobium sp.]
MDTIGYSTGALARSDVHGAFDLLAYRGTGAVELSALRVHELGPLLQAIPDLPLAPFPHISVHAPSAFTAAQEPEIAAALLPVARAGWLVVVHPDTIHDPRPWRRFGAQLCIENMDVRKPVGRTVQELLPVFARLPRASFCFDVAHARQCDPTMGEAVRLLQAFGDRLAEVHVSELDAHSRHVRLSAAGIRACRQVAALIPSTVPAIIEAPVRPHEIEPELQASLRALGRSVAVACAA